MFNLDVETTKLENFKKLLNKANINNIVFGKSEDGVLTTLKFEKQKELDKATEVLKTMQSIKSTYRSRTDLNGFAIRCLTAWLRCRNFFVEFVEPSF